MKVGVITTHYASNYGALLQTYALQTYLSDYLGCDSEVISYYPAHYKENWNIYSNSKNWKDKIMNIYMFAHPGIVREKKKRFKALKSFICDNIRCSTDYFCLKEIEADKCTYDALICGSDQIWNVSRHTEIDPVWFLYLQSTWNSAKKIAYAPSVADEIPERMKKTLSTYLNNLDAISVREDADVAKISRLTDKNVEHVCDPVFLIPHDRWEKLSKKPHISEDYICCYFLNPGDVAVQAVEKIRKITGLKVVHININSFDKFNSEYDVRSASPFEFIGYIQNAKYVITNSFHCTAFSVLFNKNYFVIPKGSANLRMESLLRKVGQEERVLHKQDIDQLTIRNLDVNCDSNESNRQMELFVDTSKKFLQTALGVYE